MSIPPDFLAELAGQQKSIEEELHRHLMIEVGEVVRSWPPYERQKAFEQTLNLKNGRDCNYDRPSVGVAYATWYMPRRIQDATRLLAPLFLSWRGPEICIADLGCGTGATWWACRAIVSAMRSTGHEPPSIRVIGCDSSTQMLALAGRLWGHLPTESKVGISVEARLSSWTHLSGIPDGSVIFASYLMDQSDKHRVAEVGSSMRRLADSHRSEHILVIGAANKRHITGLGVQEILTNDDTWTADEDPAIRQVWHGPIPALTEVRREFARDCEGETRGYSERVVPSWSSDDADFRLLHRSSFRTLLSIEEKTTLGFDESQERAATPDGRMSAILGSAGSGKSRVLAERIARSVAVDLTGTTGSKSYLVTCFNHAVRLQLQNWFIDRMKRDAKFGREVRHQGETVTVADRVTLRFITWDAVIKRSFGLSGTPSADSAVVIERIMDRWRQRSPDNDRFLTDNPWVTPEFVAQEIKRVVYGLGATTEEKYVAVKRIGRPALPRRGEQVRRDLWRLLGPESREKLFVDWRIKALELVAGGFTPPKYDRIFLDECQDFTAADFRILEALLADPRALVVCGDGTQAMHIGPGYFRPRSVGGARWETHTLEGSYRLPIRVSEAIEPIARAIQSLRRRQRGESPVAEEDIDDIMLPASVKGAVLGVRPILIAADNREQIAQQLFEVMHHYRDYVVLDHDRPTIVNADSNNRELDFLVEEAARREGLDYQVENSSMIRIKGLERPFVLWYSRFGNSNIPATATYEWIYTILTRSTRLLVILLSSGASNDVKALIGRLRSDCLLFWDATAEARFKEYAAVVGTSDDPFVDT